ALCLAEVKNNDIVNCGCSGSAIEDWLGLLPDSITINNILFEADKYTLYPSSVVDLERIVAFCNIQKNYNIAVSGHADNTGSEVKNKELSVKRAKTVADYIKARGVESNRISYTGYGSSRPIENNTTYDGKALNRRVEIRITKK
ncbi:MAG: OmpA family protein, partial [Bacteroidota bacterium]